jgi:hypothetical protein
LEVGWLVGWLNILGQVAGISSTEFGLSNMIWAAVVVAKDGKYEVTSGKVVGLFVGLLVFHGILVRLGMSACQWWSWPPYDTAIKRRFSGYTELPCHSSSRNLH